MGLGLLSPARRPGLYGTGDYSPRPKAGTETAVLSQRLGLYGTGDCSPQPKVGTGTEALSTRSGPQSAVRDCMWLGSVASSVPLSNGTRVEPDKVTTLPPNLERTRD